VSNRGFSLIGTLAAVAIVVVLAAFLLPRYLGGRDEAGKKVSAPITKARETVCRVNLQTVRQAIEAERASDPDGRAPASLSELRGLPSEVTRCDVSGKPYIYDPGTGGVRCTTPGHESY
jgi:type II secretory pathway pseudopilin PulG